MRLARALLAVLTVGIAGCNCNGDTVCTYLTSSTTTSTSTSGSAEGIWTGTDSASGLELTGLIDANGQADFIRADGVQFIGTVQVSDSTLELALNGYTQYGYQFSDSTTSGTGTFSGTFSSGSSITGTLQFATVDDTSISSTWSLTFDSLYSTASSLAAIAGTYTDSLAAVSNGLDPMSGSSVTISSAGVLYAQGSTDDCVANGTVTVVDATYDLYQVSYTDANCSGSYAVLNGVQFTGLLELNPDTSPQEIVMAVTGASTTATYYAIVSELTTG